MTSPNWVAFNLDTEAPSDQALDDSRSMTFDTAPLSANIETMGTPAVTLDLSVDKPVALSPSVSTKLPLMAPRLALHNGAEPRHKRKRGRPGQRSPERDPISQKVVAYA